MFHYPHWHWHHRKNDEEKSFGSERTRDDPNQTYKFRKHEFFYLPNYLPI